MDVKNTQSARPHALVVAPFFPPETGGSQNRLISLVNGMARAGFELDVVTPKPNYPRGVIWPEYRRGFCRTEHAGPHQRVHRIWTFADRRRSRLQRIVSYLGFVPLAIAAALLIVRRRPDVVVASSPPLFAGLAGVLLAKVYRVPFVFDVRDVWPDVAIEIGELRADGRATKLARKLELWLYAKASAITVATRGYLCTISGRTTDRQKIMYIPNGSNLQPFSSSPNRHAARRELGLPEDAFILSYCGNVGIAQGLDHVIQTAKERPGTDVHLVIVGDGAEFDRLKRMSENTRTIEFTGRVDGPAARKYMSASDALLVSLRRGSSLAVTVPSKLYDSMAASRIVIAGVEGEAESIVNDSGCGVAYAPGSPAGFRTALDRVVAMSECERDARGARGRAAVEKDFDRKAIADGFAAMVLELVVERSD